MIRRRRRSPRRRIGALLAVALAAGAAAVAVRGPPEIVVRRLLAPLSGGAYWVEFDRAAFRLLEGLRFSGLRVYRKGVVGPPVLEAEEARAELDLLSALSGQSVLRALRLSGVRFRPELDRGPAASPGRGHPREEAFDLEARRVELAQTHFPLIKARLRLGAHGLQAGGTQVWLDEDGPPAATGSLEIRPDAPRVSGEVVTRLDPRRLLPMLRACQLTEAEALAQQFEFAGPPPEAQVRFRFEGGDTQALSVQADARLRDFGFRGVPVTAADAGVQFDSHGTQRVITVRPLRLRRPEGTAQVAFTLRSDARTVDFEGDSTLDPRALARMLGIFQDPWAQYVRLEGAFSVSARGRASLDDPRERLISGSCRGDGIGYAALLTDSFQFSFLTRGLRHDATDARGQWCGGVLAGSATLAEPPPEGGDSGTCAFELLCEDADFSRVMRALWPAFEGDPNGRFSVSGAVSGPLASNYFHGAEGAGRMRVSRGRVFSLPLFGGFTRRMSKMLPGLDFVLRQEDATASFRLAGGKLASDDLAIEGDVLSLRARGASTLEGVLDFTVQVRLLRARPLFGRVVRFVSWPVSKLLESRVGGTLDQPEWDSWQMARELIRKSGRGLRSLWPGGADEPAEPAP